jgi:hypothetical protein
MMNEKKAPAKKKKKKIESMADLREVAKEKASGVDDGMDDYKVKDAADTIMKAHEHMADEAMMEKVKPHLDKKKKAIDSIASLRAVAKEKLGY